MHEPKNTKKKRIKSTSIDQPDRVGFNSELGETAALSTINRQGSGEMGMLAKDHFNYFNAYSNDE